MSNGASETQEKKSSVNVHDLLAAIERTKQLPDTKRALRNTLTNYVTETYETEDGKTKSRKVGLEAHEIWANLKHLTGDAIKRVRNKIFANGNGEIQFFESSSDFIGWVTAHNIAVDWTSRDDAISKEEFIKYIGNVAKPYQCATALPHYPEYKEFYYIKKIEPTANGYFQTLLDFFSPATTYDAALLKAALMTPFWGGDFGKRPSFVIDGLKNDPLSNRGIGKTTVADVAAKLAGGYVDLSARTEDEKIRKLLLTAGDIRVIRFDNIKADKFSSETIENLITAPEISGHQMYSGHNAIPNWFTVYITFNDANLSKDMSQRSVIIRLKRPPDDAGWWERIEGFIKQYRNEIISDIGSILSMETPEGFTPKTRFKTWEKAILSKCSKDTQEVQNYIVREQSETDDDNKLRQEISEIIQENMNSYYRLTSSGQKYFEANNDSVAFNRKVIIDWISELFPKNYSRRYISKQLEKHRPLGLLPGVLIYSGGHYLVWSARRLVEPSGALNSAWRVEISNSEVKVNLWNFNNPVVW